jgi:CarboxypepD_reg-like domain/TonB dependent receptor-like, beta-barrel/TonB-dependent Receptor Plug Domain
MYFYNKAIDTFLIAVFIFILGMHPLLAEEQRGTIKGTITDKETQSPVIGANVFLLDTSLGAATDEKGNYTINKVPVGNYVLNVSFIGYEPVKKTDVIVRPQHITWVNGTLEISALETDAIVVEGGYFSQAEEKVSSINFSAEEIRRAPGSAGDVSRIIYGLPGIAKINDQKNTLLVRGGSAFENAFYVDNIEIPNINHFPDLGSSAGPIGILNVDFIEDVDFSAGGFSAAYGDRLSSVMNISFREGNREHYNTQFDFNFAGIGGIIEGPVANGKGSWFFSARQSYLNLILNAIGEDESSIPNYADIQGKFVYDISDKSQISIINITAVDDISGSRQGSIDQDESHYANFKYTGITTGINWRYLWQDAGYSNTSLAATSRKYDATVHTTRDAALVADWTTSDISFNLRNSNYYKFDNSHKVEFGMEVKHLISDFDNYYGEYNDVLGNVTAEYTINKKINSDKYDGFASYIWSPVKRLTLTPGIRIGYFSYNKHYTLDPRFSITYQFNDKTSMTASAGLYHQNVPLILLSQNEANKNLKDMQARQYILSLNHLLTEDTRLTIDLFDKQYSRFPVDPLQPSIFILDQSSNSMSIINGNPLLSKGEAFSRGVEVIVQKKLAQSFYGMISGSFSQAKYTALDDIERNRLYDNRYTFNIEGGYKPNKYWEFSTRWIYAGGSPYTPFDIEKSTAARRGVFDEDQINGKRKADYHSLNIRADRRFYFNSSSMIIYLSIWNAYGRENISEFEWNENNNALQKSTQWGMLPVFGIEYEF